MYHLSYTSHIISYHPLWCSIFWISWFSEHVFPGPRLLPRHLAGHSLLDAIMDMAEVWRWENVGVAVGKLHPWKVTCPLKRDYFNRKYIFQPLIFRGHSFVFRRVGLEIGFIYVPLGRWSDFIAIFEQTRKLKKSQTYMRISINH